MGATAFITGLGLATPLGDSLTSTWNTLLAGKFLTDHAQVPGIPYSSDRLFTIALQVAQEAIIQAGWTSTDLRDSQTALIVGTSKGSITSVLTPPPQHISEPTCVAAGRFCSVGLSEITARIGQTLNTGHGPRLTFSAACASGLQALIRGAMMIESGEVSRALVIACESSVHPLFISSFRRLGVLPKVGIGCRPFDIHRDGFLVSEAAAAVCVESSYIPKSIARIDRYAFGGDATHITASDPQGETLKYLLGRVIEDQPVDLIHAHGTGTITNDPIELQAIESSIHQPSMLYSHKGSLGHSLGAAGLVSIGLSCKMHQTGLIPPNIQTRNPLPTSRVIIHQNAMHSRINRSLVIAAGFGGSVAVVSLKTP